MSFLTDIVANPAGYLDLNLVQFRSRCPLNPGTTGTFVVKADNTAHVRYRTGTAFLAWGNKKADGRLFEVKYQKPGEPSPTGNFESFDAIWSGYAGSKATHCTLTGGNGGPDVMFTPILDGCTVTYVSLAGGGMKFGHYNLKDTTDPVVANQPTLAGPEMVKAAKANYGNHNPAVLSKEYYYSKAKRNSSTTGMKRTTTNVIGVRVGGHWRVFAQYVEPKGIGAAQTFQIRGVEELTNGTCLIDSV